MNDQALKSNPLVQLTDEVARLQGRFRSLFAAVQAETGLKGMGDLVLNAIAEAERPPTVPQIGRSLGHPRQVIQRAVEDLIAAGYLERLPNPDHKRAPLLALSAQGKLLKRRSDALALDIAGAFLQRVEAERCLRLARELREVRKAIENMSRDEI